MKITPFRGNVRVVETFTYKDVTIEAGYLSNGATLYYLFYSLALLGLVSTWFLWLLVLALFIVRTPFYPSSLRGAVVHDYLCELGEYEKADRYYIEILLEDEDRVRAYSKWIGVRIYHFITRKNI